MEHKFKAHDSGQSTQHTRRTGAKLVGFTTDSIQPISTVSRAVEQTSGVAGEFFQRKFCGWDSRDILRQHANQKISHDYSTSNLFN